MFVCRTAGFICRDEGSELVKSFMKSVDFFDAFDFQGDYRIGKAFFGGCRFCFALSDECTKMRNAQINKLDIIIQLDFLKGMEMH